MSIDKYFTITLSSIIILEVLSYLAYINKLSGLLLFLIVLFITLILSLKKLEYGLFIMLTELFIGGKGYLFAINISETQLSIRIGLFLVIISVWLYKKYANKQFNAKYFHKLLDKNRLLSLAYIFLMLFICIGVVQGFLKNDFNNLFFDFNAWIFFGLFIIFIEQLTTYKQIKNILSIFLAAITWVSIKTIILLYLFSHRFVIIGDSFYKWIRNSGVGEITWIIDDVFRIFMQSQIYILIGFFLFLTYFIFSVRDKKIFKESKKSFSIFVITLVTILTSTALLISQSRSYWVAGFLTFIIFLIISFLILKIKRNLIIGIIAFVIILSIFDSAIIYLITQRTAFGLITARSADLTTEPASNTRLNQLEPLYNEIKKEPIIGYGYGKTVTYKSSDPRVLSTHPDGMYTTYAFEWGYLDIWLKIGFIGLLTYLTFLGLIYKLGIKFYKRKVLQATCIGFMLGLTALLLTNIFSPYLNHPLGIGFILFTSSIFLIKEKNT